MLLHNFIYIFGTFVVLWGGNKKYNVTKNSKNIVEPDRWKI